ncbi:hypothetical protein MKX01_016285 [Papaver californicum]|nr:hypothetical protein MKX01_016285 [Papaver californicum]
MGTNSTLICAPIMGKSINQIHPHQDLQTLIKYCSMLTLFTYSGEYEGDDSIRLDALKLAMELGADYIDVELQVAHEFISSLDKKIRQKSKIIVSSHDYHACHSLVEEIGDLVAEIQSTGADIVKIATTAVDVTDVACMFQTIIHSQVPFVGLVMTEKGLISRLLCTKYVSAPRQPTIKDLLKKYNLKHIGPDTKVFGIIGKPMGYIKSPPLFNKVFKSIGFNGVYVPFLVDDLANCIIHHKEVAFKCCDEVHPIAKFIFLMESLQLIEVVNTIVRRPSDRKLVDYNIDYIGVIFAIEGGLTGSDKIYQGSGSPLDGKFFVVIGAGGAEDEMILANTISVGMQPKIEETPIPKLTDRNHFYMQHALSAYALAFDVVYTPKMTRLLLEAEESGAAVVTGVDMFIGQVYEQYERFTGLSVPTLALTPKELFRETMSNLLLAR